MGAAVVVSGTKTPSWCACRSGTRKTASNRYGATDDQLVGVTARRPLDRDAEGALPDLLFGA